MPVADADKFTAEIVIAGTIAPKGSRTYVTSTTFRYRRNTGVPALNKTDIAAAFQTLLGAAFSAVLNESWTWDFIRVRFMEDPSDPYLDVVPVGAPIVGGVAGDRLPPDNTAFLLAKSAYRGKHYRNGRFLSPMSEADTTAATADLWNAACQARLATLTALLDNAFIDTAGNVWTPIIAQISLMDKTIIPYIIPYAPIVEGVARKSIGRFKRRAPSTVY